MEESAGLSLEPGDGEQTQRHRQLADKTTGRTKRRFVGGASVRVPVEFRVGSDERRENNRSTNTESRQSLCVDGTVYASIVRYLASVDTPRCVTRW